jgi:hypothetical protein
MLAEPMISFKSHIQIQRGGKQYRCNRHRFFYIKQLGWFVRMRGDLEISEGMELVDGIVGPFTTRAKAKYHLLKQIYQEHPELFAHEPVEYLNH